MRISSRKNETILHLKKLGTSAAYRRQTGQFLCDGVKLLQEALSYDARICCILTTEELHFTVPEDTKIYQVDQSLLDYVSPLKTSQKVLFSCAIPDIPFAWNASEKTGKIIILDGVQDPGNVGTVIRMAGAFEFDWVFLTGAAADPYNPKAIRATMGAIFRQKFTYISFDQLLELCRSGMKLAGTALHRDSVSLENAQLNGYALVIGSEGSGISPAVQSLCSMTVTIPMSVSCESLNAATAASILMWELTKQSGLPGRTSSCLN